MSNSPSPQKRISDPRRFNQARLNKLKMPTLNISAIGTSSNFDTTGMKHPEHLLPELDGDEEEDLNSESDSLEDLQSMLQEAEISPTR